MSNSPPEARVAVAADGQVWRDSAGRTWVALGQPARRLADRTVREVASGTKRGTIEWATSQDMSARGLFAARRALLESLSTESASKAAVPRVEGVLIGGEAIVVEDPGGNLEAWWLETGEHRDRVARYLELMAAISRAVGRVVEPAAAEGLVPVVRPRALRSHEDGRWMVTEFAALVDFPPAIGSGDVLSGFLAPETVQGSPSSDGRPRVVWGVASTIVATCAWANSSVDGATGEAIESPASHSHLGRLLSDLHTRGMFGGGGGAMQQAFERYPDPDRLPTADREMVLRFAEQSGVGRAVGASLIALLDDALTVDPGQRPSPEALAERLELVAREARAAVYPRSPSKDGGDGTPTSTDSPSPASAPDPDPEPALERPRSRRKGPSVNRVVRELQETVEQLRSDLKDTRSQVEDLRTAHEGLARAVLNKPPAPSHLGVHLGLSFGLMIALGLGVAGWFSPLPPDPERIVIPMQVDDAQNAAASTPLDPTVEPSELGTVEMLGGTISFEGERGVFGAGLVPPGTYQVVARPQRGPNQDLGEITVHAGERLVFQCAAGVCARMQE